MEKQTLKILRKLVEGLQDVLQSECTGLVPTFLEGLADDLETIAYDVEHP